MRNDILFDKAIEMFLDNCKALDRREETIIHYRRCLVKFSEFLCEFYNRPVYVSEVKPEDLEKFLFQKYNLKEYSSSARHKVETAFRSMYSYLERKKYCENKGKLIKREKVITDERETLSEMEFKRVMHYIRTPTVRAALYTLYYAGLRINEAVSLTMSDVDLEKDLIHVRDTKNKEDRSVPINPKLKKVLQDYLADGRVNYKTENFFSTYPKGQISAQQINKWIKKALKATGIEKKLSAHNLRHSFASNLVAGGVDVVTLRELLGHRNLRTTSIYCHTTFEELAEAIEVL